jgi:hypothetical protein
VGEGTGVAVGDGVGDGVGVGEGADACTVRSIVPVTLSTEPWTTAAASVEPPGPAVATPEGLTDAMGPLRTLQVTVDGSTGSVEPSSSVSVAVSCTVSPPARLVGVPPIVRSVTSKSWAA